ncbi:MAG: hypothetical protein ACREQL_10335 [Candidatus Binatia bacterium]
MRRRLAAIALVLGALAAHAEPRPSRPGLPTTPSLPVVTSCWLEPRWFTTLRDGPMDYCRRHLRYSPGKPDCTAFTDEICWAYYPDSGEWVQLRSNGQARIVVCPEGPEPPTCPRLR